MHDLNVADFDSLQKLSRLSTVCAECVQQNCQRGEIGKKRE